MNSPTDPHERRRNRPDRRILLAEDITDEELALIEAAEVPAEYAHLDAELRDSD